MMVESVEDGVPEWSPFNMRQYNLNILKPPVSVKSGSSMSMSVDAVKSLDLLRQNLQRSINEEVKSVITRYIEVYIKPGVENIKNNLGNESVTEDHLNNLCRNILEEAKRMYPVYSSTPSPSFNVNSSSSFVDDNDTSSDLYLNNSHHQQQLNNVSTNNINNNNGTEPSSLINNNKSGAGVSLSSDSNFVYQQSPTTGVKRESDDSMDTDNSRETGSGSGLNPNPTKKIKKSNSTKGGGGGGSNGASETSTSTTSSVSPAKQKKPTGPSRKHVAQWDSNTLSPETSFIMGAKANKALGFAQTRGRLYVKHPCLFKYASDTDDKEWLSKNKLMPATGGRAYIMLLDDIEKLARDNKLNVTINYEDIKGFRVPEFILNKMKNYIDTWKKIYADEAAALATKSSLVKPRSQSLGSSNSNNTLANNNSQMKAMSMSLGIGASLAQSCPPPPPPPLHSLGQQHHLQNQAQSTGGYHLGGVPGVMFDQQLQGLPDFNIMDKPPPMYPGHSTVVTQSQDQQQQVVHTQNQSGMNSSNLYNQHQPPPPPPPLPPPSGGGQHLDPVEQAISKGDWSNISDRSLLLYALQSTRNIGSWDPQDSFDLIESVSLSNESGSVGSGGGSNIGDGSGGGGGMLQMPSEMSGMQLTATSVGMRPASPNCELSSVLDAFQYTET